MGSRSLIKRLAITLFLIGSLAGTAIVAGSGRTASANRLETVLLSGQRDLNVSPTPAAYLPLVFQGQERVDEIRFAVIGDYGNGSQNEANVAALIKSWNPDFIITTGDNNYPDGDDSTIDENIGQFFNEFIAPYKGSYGAGAQENRFFPSLGNHDWYANNAQPYLDYFTLLGNERYYDFTWGPVRFFAVDSDSNEPDGAHSSSVQAAWLQTRLVASNSPWNIVYFHHSPFSSSFHGPSKRMQWPFAQWGADVVISGHDHTYERISRDGIWYLVNGLGGAGQYDFVDIIEAARCVTMLPMAPCWLKWAGR
jgi:tartrate-resistant acid phosphatase type 5